MNALIPKEVTIIQMALIALIEDMTEVSKEPSYPFTPESRKDMNDILSNAKSALDKIALASGKLVQLDAYNEGDEIEFLTKQS